VIPRDEAFMVLWEFRPFIMKLAQKYACTFMSSEDIFQELMARHVKDIERTSNDKTHAMRLLFMYASRWIYGIICSFRHTRIVQNADGQKEIILHDFHVPMSVVSPEDILPIEARPDAKLGEIATFSELEDELKRFPEKQQEIFFAKIAGKTYKEIAQERGCTPQRICQIFHQMRKDILAHLTL